MIKEEKLITLREAARISGYSSDYIGQLIRSGRLEGEQVYSNVAWMTTETALLAYMEKDKKMEGVRAASARKLISPGILSSAYLGLSWFFIASSSLFIVFLAYITAVSVDHAIEHRYLLQIQRDHDT